MKNMTELTITILIPKDAFDDTKRANDGDIGEIVSESLGEIFGNVKVIKWSAKHEEVKEAA